MKTLQEIFALPTEAEKIDYLKHRRTPLPDAEALYKDWDPDKHDVMDPEIRPDGKVIVEEAKQDPKTGKVIPAQYKKDDVNPTNRIPLPLEQDITNIHTAWTVGKDPKVNCSPNNEEEKELLNIIDSICRKTRCATTTNVSSDLGSLRPKLLNIGTPLRTKVFGVRCWLR